MTARKTFIPDEVLLAEDINDGLNPTTALHIPYAVAAGQASVTFSASNTATVSVSLPPGRFSRIPILVATLAGTGNLRLTLRAQGTSATAATITATTADNSNVTLTATVSWIAIQMTETAPNG